MKALSDEEIQKLLESGNPLPEKGSQSDYQAYQYVFQALKAEPDFELADDFSDQLVKIVGRQVTYRLNLHYYLLLTSISLFALILGIAAVAFVNKPLVINLLNFIWEERWIVLSATIMFLAIQVSDKLIKKYVLHYVQPFH